MSFVSNAPGKKAGSAIGIAVVEQSAAQSTAFFPLQNKLPSSLYRINCLLPSPCVCLKMSVRKFFFSVLPQECAFAESERPVG